MPTDLRTPAARRRAELVSDGVTASYIHSLARPARRAGSARPAPLRLRPGARPRRVPTPASVAA
jgi:hypothetical protein